MASPTSNGALPVPTPKPRPLVMDISRKNFPKDFVFGVATSAYQVEGIYAEGGRGLANWDVFSNGYPRYIVGGANGNVADDMYSRYKEDIKLMKTMGFDAYRFSISWSRVIPGGKRSLGVNQEGIDYYNDVINTVIENGMKPLVTIFHFDTPFLLEQLYGGFLGEEIVDDFRDYAELCFLEFGDRVKHWITTNEAWTYSVYGYVNRTFPPGKGYFGPSKKEDTELGPELGPGPVIEPLTEDLGQCFIPYRGVQVAKEATVVSNNKTIVLRRLVTPPITNDPEKSREVYTAGRHFLLSHAAAVELYRKKFQGFQNGKIGMTNNITWFVPFNDTKEDRQAARRAFDFMLGWFLEPLLTGQYPKTMLKYAKDHITPFTPEESKLLKGSSDFLGINFYSSCYAANEPHPGPDVEGYYRDLRVRYYYYKNGVPIGEPTGSSWLYVTPWAMYNLLEFITMTYNKHGNIPPIYITENGCSHENDPLETPFQACKDEQRLGYFHGYLSYLHRAMTDFPMTKVESYFVWSYCDNFEWNDGYKSRFGIVFIDYKDELKRYRKDSAIWFTMFLQKKGGLLLEENDVASEGEDTE